jgi:hypothetical protein
MLSSDQSSRLHIQRSGFDSRRCLIFWEVADLERGPLSLVRIIEELFQGNSRALTSPTSGGRSVGIVRLRTTGHGGWFACKKTSVLRISTRWKSDRTNVSMLIEDMSRNKCFFPGSNFTCFTFYIYLWSIYWLSLVSTGRVMQLTVLISEVFHCYLLHIKIPSNILPPNSNFMCRRNYDGLSVCTSISK